MCTQQGIGARRAGQPLRLQEGREHLWSARPPRICTRTPSVCPATTHLYENTFCLPGHHAFVREHLLSARPPCFCQRWPFVALRLCAIWPAQTRRPIIDKTPPTTLWGSMCAQKPHMYRPVRPRTRTKVRIRLDGAPDASCVNIMPSRVAMEASGQDAAPALLRTNSRCERTQRESHTQQNGTHKRAKTGPAGGVLYTPNKTVPANHRTAPQTWHLDKKQKCCELQLKHPNRSTACTLAVVACADLLCALCCSSHCTQ
jgi:hypothetical protein